MLKTSCSDCEDDSTSGTQAAARQDWDLSFILNVLVDRQQSPASWMAPQARETASHWLTTQYTCRWLTIHAIARSGYRGKESIPSKPAFTMDRSTGPNRLREEAEDGCLIRQQTRD